MPCACACISVLARLPSLPTSAAPPPPQKKKPLPLSGLLAGAHEKRDEHKDRQDKVGAAVGPGRAQHEGAEKQEEAQGQGGGEDGGKHPA